MLKARLVLFGLWCVVFGFLAGCSGVRMNVDSFNNPYLPLAEYKKFSFLPSDVVDKAKEQRLFAVVKKEMEVRGLVFDDKAPQFFIALNVKEDVKKGQNANSKNAEPEVTSKITVVLIDNKYTEKSAGAKMLWQGEASTSGPLSEISSIDVEKCLILGIMQAYPQKIKSTPKNINSFWCRK